MMSPSNWFTWEDFQRLQWMRMIELLGLPLAEFPAPRHDPSPGD